MNIFEGWSKTKKEATQERSKKSFLKDYIKVVSLALLTVGGADSLAKSPVDQADPKVIMTTPLVGADNPDNMESPIFGRYEQTVKELRDKTKAVEKSLMVAAEKNGGKLTTDSYEVLVGDNHTGLGKYFIIQDTQGSLGFIDQEGDGVPDRIILDEWWHSFPDKLNHEKGNVRAEDARSSNAKALLSSEAELKASVIEKPENFEAKTMSAISTPVMTVTTLDWPKGVTGTLPGIRGYQYKAVQHGSYPDHVTFKPTFLEFTDVSAEDEKVVTDFLMKVQDQFLTHVKAADSELQPK